MGFSENPSATVDAPDPKELMAKFGRVLRRRRQAARLGQEAFSDKVGMHRTTCSLIERGRQSPTLALLARMAAALNATMAEIINEVESPDPPPEGVPAAPPAITPGRRTRENGRASS